MTEIPKAAPSVHYNKEMEEKEKNKETKAKDKRQAQLLSALRPSLLRKGETLRCLLETAIAVGNLAIGTEAKSTLSQV